MFLLVSVRHVACEQALLFGRVKQVSRERASARRSREGQTLCGVPGFPGSSTFLGPSLARSREARFACPNRRACSQAMFFNKIGAMITHLYHACNFLALTSTVSNLYNRILIYQELPWWSIQFHDYPGLANELL